MRAILTALVLLMAPFAAAAQNYPVYAETAVNDFADLLPDDVEARLREQISTLKSETGVELTVITLPDQASFSPDETFETFATNLFNKWGVGDAKRNDGIIVLVMHRDRTMRIELGSGYPVKWNRVADNVIDNHFLPEFKNGNYAAGIENGVAATIDDIALPHHAGTDPDAIDDGSFWGWAAKFIALPVALIFAAFRLFKWSRRCPNCNARGTLKKSRETLSEANDHKEGQARQTVTCTNCAYISTALITLPIVTNDPNDSSSGGGSFGGGSSSGGGSSGSW